MTTTIKDTATMARARTDALHGPDRMERGDIASMMLAAGFSPDRARAAVHFFTRFLRADMIGIIGVAAVDAMEAVAEARLADAERTVA